MSRTACSLPFSINITAPVLDTRLEPMFLKALEALKTQLQPSAQLRTDSRTIRPGDALLAYTTQGSNRYQQIQDALRRGASLVLYEEDAALPPAIEIENLATDSSAIQGIEGLTQLAGPLASAWYSKPSSDLFVVGITGTNGKTSCSHGIAEALCNLHLPCAIIGTLGSGTLNQLTPTGFTTPNAPEFQYQLAQCRDEKVCAVAFEASSHALRLGRLNGTAIDIAVFTNLSQDHLDYHLTLDAYTQAKADLFKWPNLSCVVINRDDPVGTCFLAQTHPSTRTIAYGIHTDKSPAHFNDPISNHIDTPSSPSDIAFHSMSWPSYAKACKKRRSDFLASHRADLNTPPSCPEFIYASKLRPTSVGVAFEVHSSWGQGHAEITGLGTFSVSNALAILGTLIAANIPFERALPQLIKLTPVVGRMQKVGGNLQANEPLVVIDYAHTPDALEKVLTVLRDVVQHRGGQLACVVGCGGDREVQKRPMMGKIAEQLADKVVLTSDNPRSESPASIIDQMLAGMHHPEQAKRFEDRAIAILQTIRQAQAKDIVLIAGKGHETTQDIQGRKLPFSDEDHARLALAARGINKGEKR